MDLFNLITLVVLLGLAAIWVMLNLVDLVVGIIRTFASVDGRVKRMTRYRV